MVRRRLLVLGALALLAAGCGGDDEPTAADAAEDGGAAAAAEAEVAVAETSLGEVLVDGEGMTLYLFTPDGEGKSACVGACVALWPPVEGEPAAGEGVNAELIGTITRDDGSTQATYDGHPLYRYAPDREPGDVTGQGVEGTWFVVDPAGEAVTDEAPGSDAAGGTGDTTAPAAAGLPGY